MVFRFKKSDFKRGLTNSLSILVVGCISDLFCIWVFEIDKETEDKKEKRVKKQLDDVRNQLERVSFFEENIMPVQRQP